MASALSSACLNRSRLAMSGSKPPARTVTPIPTRPRKTCWSGSILLRRSWSFISPGDAMRMSADSPAPTRRSSCCGLAYEIRRRFLVSLRYCSATFVMPGASAAELSTLTSAAAAAPGRAHANSSAVSRMIRSRARCLLDACGDEKRLGVGAAQETHEGPRKLGVRGGGHRRRSVRRVILDVGGQRPDQLQPLVAMEQDLGHGPEADLLAFSLQHVLHHRARVRIARGLGLDLLVQAHFLEQVLEVDPGRGAVEHDRVRLQQRALERVGARNVGQL